MRLPIAATLVLVALVDARPASVSHRQSPSFANDDTFNGTAARDYGFDSDDTITIAADLWQEAIDRGTKLLTGMKSDDNTAAALYGFPTETAESPFDGSLVDEMRKWGYTDNTPAMQKTHDKECNMASASGNMLSTAFAALGKALLGSPVGRWAGYFLMQHKRQLGGGKWVEEVRVFRSEKEGSWPYLLFYVAGSVAERGGQDGGKLRAKL